jgi:hypothetical protein
MENGSSQEGKDPSAFLSEIIGAPVTVKLNSGVVYKGRSLLSLLESESMSFTFFFFRRIAVGRWIHEYSS